MDLNDTNAGLGPFSTFMLALGASIRDIDSLPPPGRSTENFLLRFENALDSFEKRYRASRPDDDHELYSMQLTQYHMLLVASLQAAVDQDALPDDWSLRLVHSRDKPQP